MRGGHRFADQGYAPTVRAGAGVPCACLARYDAPAGQRKNLLRRNATGRDHTREVSRIRLSGPAMLAGATATAFAPLASSAARAAAPASGAQAPSFYRYKVGSFECTSLADGARTFPMPDGFVKNVPKDQALAAAEAAYMPKGMVTVPFNPQVINTGAKIVLIDP